MPLNAKLFCQQIDQKSTLWWNELLNTFFHRCRYKCCFRFCAFRFEATPHLSCYLISFADKRHHGQLLLLFLCNFCTFFSSVGGVLVINLFLIDGYILAIQQQYYNTQGAFVVLLWSLCGVDIYYFRRYGYWINSFFLTQNLPELK